MLGKRAVMFPIAYPPGNIADRSLQQDDRAGLSDVYGGVSFRRETGSISGRVTLNGAGVFGAHVVAFSPETGEFVSTFSLSETGAFPTVMVQLAALGEETGRLAEFLGKAAELLEAQVERAVQRLVALAEPVMIIVFGGLVGFVALSLLQAIYSVNAGSFR